MSGLAGKTLGAYQIIEKIGHGGMANVYRAIQPSIGREVAIKVLPPELLRDETFLKRFSREVQVIARLQHPRILPVYDFGEQDGTPYIVMAYLSGGTLADRISQHENGMPIRNIARFTHESAEALDYAHQLGIIHRDYKPSNVLLDDQGFSYLADFGVARIDEATAQLTGSGVIGTPFYMAPEMSTPDGLSPSIDVYALAVTVYQMCTGHYPYRAPTPVGVLAAHITQPIPDARKLRADLPDDIQAIIEKGMAKDPYDRYSTAGELAAALGLVTDENEAEWADPETYPEAEDIPIESAPTTSPDDLTMDRSESILMQPPAERGPVIDEGSYTPPALASERRKRSGVKPLWIGLGGVALIGVLIIGSLALSGVGGNDGEQIAVTETDEPVVEDVAVDEEPEAPTITPVPTANTAQTNTPAPLCFAPVIDNDLWLPHIETFDGVEMALVPVGCFLMGGDEHDKEKPIHEICFEEPFWIDVYEVTNKQIGTWPEDNLPREDIAWGDALAHCESRGARLPTEAEWEYAARGPDNLKWPWGNYFDEEIVVYGSNSGGRTSEVGSKPGGASWIGAFDMGGNLREWVNDWFSEDYYSISPQVNPQGPDSGETRVLKGGGKLDNGSDIRTAARNYGFPDELPNSFGFRCARDYEP